MPNSITVITSLLCGFRSAPDHLSDSGVLTGEVILPVRQIFLSLVVSEMHIVLSHEEQYFHVVGVYLTEVHWLSGILAAWLGPTFPLSERLGGGHIALLGQSRHAEGGSSFPDPDRLDQCSMTFDHCNLHGLIVSGMFVMQDQLELESFIQQSGQESFDEIALIVELCSVVEAQHYGQVCHGGFSDLLSPSLELTSLGREMVTWCENPFQIFKIRFGRNVHDHLQSSRF